MLTSTRVVFTPILKCIGEIASLITRSKTQPRLQILKLCCKRIVVSWKCKLAHGWWRPGSPEKWYKDSLKRILIPHCAYYQSQWTIYAIYMTIWRHRKIKSKRKESVSPGQTLSCRRCRKHNFTVWPSLNTWKPAIDVEASPTTTNLFLIAS